MSQSSYYHKFINYLRGNQLNEAKKLHLPDKIDADYICSNYFTSLAAMHSDVININKCITANEAKKLHLPDKIDADHICSNFFTSLAVHSDDMNINK